MTNSIPSDNETISVNGILYSHKDIHRVVEEFYSLVEHDPILSVPFQSVHDWPEHIRRLTHFWWIRFGGKPYMKASYNPVLKHFEAGFNAEFLARWLMIFHNTLEKNLTKEQAQLWTQISKQMGQSLFIRNEQFKKDQIRY